MRCGSPRNRGCDGRPTYRPDLGEDVSELGHAIEAGWRPVGRCVRAAHRRRARCHVPCDSYKLGGQQVIPKLAKERALEMLTRVLAKLP